VVTGAGWRRWPAPLPDGERAAAWLNSRGYDNRTGGAVNFVVSAPSQIAAGDNTSVTITRAVKKPERRKESTERGIWDLNTALISAEVFGRDADRLWSSMTAGAITFRGVQRGSR
jgi:hypothetical protein